MFELKDSTVFNKECSSYITNKLILNLCQSNGRIRSVMLHF